MMSKKVDRDSNFLSSTSPKTVSSMSSDGTVKIQATNLDYGKNRSKLEIWRNGQSVGAPILMGNLITSLAFSPDGQQFVLGSYDYIESRDINAPLRVIWSSQFQYGRIDRLFFSGDAAQIAAIKQPDEWRLSAAHEMWFLTMSLDDRGDAKRKGDEIREKLQNDEHAVIYAAQNGQKNCEVVMGQVTSERHIGFPFKHLLVATGDKKGTVNFWDTSPGWKLNRRIRTIESAYAFGVSNDGHLLATVSQTDNIQDLALVHMWDLPSGEILQTIRLRVPSRVSEAIQLGYSRKAEIDDVIDLVGEQRRGYTVFAPDNSALALTIVVTFPGISAHHGIIEFVPPEESTYHQMAFLISINDNHIQEISPAPEKLEDLFLK
jgi:WD40 repeat protein